MEFIAVLVLVAIAVVWALKKFLLDDQASGSASAPKETKVVPAAEMRQILQEIQEAESRGGSFWKEGADIAEAHGTTIWVVSDFYVAEGERRDAREERERTRVRKVLAEVPSTPTDLRVVTGARVGVVGSSHWVAKDELDAFEGTVYYLRREPSNRHDQNAIAVYGENRKFGYLSRASAEKYAPLLDRLGATFVVTRDLSLDGAYLLMPRLPTLRKLADGAVG